MADVFRVVDWARRRKAAIIISLAVLFLSIMVLWFLSLHFRFLISDELNIHLEPLSIAIDQTDREPTLISFTVTNNNFRNCRATCSLSLVDLATSEVLEYHEQSFDHLERVNINYLLDGPDRGSGQHLYQFRIMCQNQKTTLCRTPGEERTIAALIVQEYKLSQQESEQAAALLPQLSAYLDQVSSLMQEREILEDLLLRLKKNEGSLHVNVSQIPFLEVINEAQHNQDAWEDYRFSDIRLPPRYYPLAARESTLALIERAYHLLFLRSRSVEALHDLAEQVADIEAARLFFLNETNRANVQSLSDLESLAESLAASLDEIEDSDNEEVFRVIDHSIEGMRAILSDYRMRRSAVSSHADSLRVALAHKEFNHSIVGDSCLSLQMLVLAAEGANEASLALRTTQFPHSYSQDHEDVLRNASGMLFTEPFPGLSAPNLTREEIMLLAQIDLTGARSILASSCKSFTLDRIPTPMIENIITRDLRGYELPIRSAPIVDFHALFPAELVDRCCSLGGCSFCSDGPKTPLLFIHGHSMNEKNTPDSSMNLFARLQRELQEDGYIDAGQLDLTAQDIPSGIWGRNEHPIAVRATYYYITDVSFGEYHLWTRKSERIENYALRLDEIIHLLSERTGSSQVDIVAHSMGGLVARQYGALFGYDSIRTLILVNTPNKGVVDRISSFCPLLGSSRECEDLAQGSVFLNRLNSVPLPESASVHAIRSIGCAMEEGDGDGIVLERDARLQGAVNHVISGRCEDALNTDLHTRVMDPLLYPETKELILSILAS